MKTPWGPIMGGFRGLRVGLREPTPVGKGNSRTACHLCSGAVEFTAGRPRSVVALIPGMELLTKIIAVARRLMLCYIEALGRPSPPSRLSSAAEESHPIRTGTLFRPLA
jgi:hypothetical protein